ncbi:MAG TPA: phosphotransferase [Solirubrobacteraceae bacterium]|nr:phosphotransferase [Solirubrobacteraceae bacterium]
MASVDLAALDEEKLAAWLLDRRWFGSKARDVASIHVLDVVPIHDGPPALSAALVEARYPGGTHDVYQLLMAVGSDGLDDSVVDEVGGVAVYDAFADPRACDLLGGLLRDGAEVRGEHARIEFHWREDVDPPRPGAKVRPIGAEQSNTSIVFDDALVLKAFRRVEAGDNPELEMLRFLSGRDFPHIAELGGWYQYEGELMDATLGVVQRFVPDARDGWELALDELGSDPERFVTRLRDLGTVIGRMHTVLASDPTDPAFAPEEPSDESLALLTATIDEEIERVFLELPDLEAVAPIVGQGAQVRDRLQLLSHVGARGKLIRTHGDLHLGQTMLGDGDWVILDFEGEPARRLLERRRKRSPLRDVAGMLRSFAYAASASDVQRGHPAPEGWVERAREAFLGGYLEAVDSVLLPPGEAPTRTMLSIFELEKAVYELRYELNNRPDWVGIPVAGITRLLEEPL